MPNSDERLNSMALQFPAHAPVVLEVVPVKLAVLRIQRRPRQSEPIGCQVHALHCVEVFVELCDCIARVQMGRAAWCLPVLTKLTFEKTPVTWVNVLFNLPRGGGGSERESLGERQCLGVSFRVGAAERPHKIWFTDPEKDAVQDVQNRNCQ